MKIAWSSWEVRSSYRRFELLGGNFTSVVEGNHFENSALFFDWNPQNNNKYHFI